MTNLFDYILWRGDLTFSQAPVSSVDLLIFSEIVHAPLENLKPGYEGKTLLELFREVYPSPVDGKENSLLPSRYRIWKLMETRKRFAEVRLLRFASRFEPENTRQFAGALFSIGDSAVVAFRGTDSTITGWKEDFLMGFESPIPAQTDALEFLNSCPAAPGDVYVCGHSKGGNLAMYAASQADNRSRIRGVISFDGPGLDESVLNTPGWKDIIAKTRLIVPESSIIGLLLGYLEDHETIASDSMSIMQHNPFYWHVLGREFVKSDSSTFSSRLTDNALHRFIAKCPKDQRRRLFEASCEILEATGAQKTSELMKCIITHQSEIKAVVDKLEPEDRQAFKTMFGILKDSYGSSLKQFLDIRKGHVI